VGLVMYGDKYLFNKKESNILLRKSFDIITINNLKLYINSEKLNMLSSNYRSKGKCCLLGQTSCERS
jgi:hypothetical protein